MSCVLELADIQGTVLRNRPMPYCGTYLVFSIDDARSARALIRRLIPHIASAQDWSTPVDAAWINVVFTCEGLRRLEVPEQVIAGFPPEFRQGMAARAAYLGDVGRSAPENWNFPHAHNGFHIGLFVMAPDAATRDEKLAIGHAARSGVGGINLIAHLDVGVPPTMREHFGYADGISRPFIEGEGGTPLPGQGAPAKAGEFILGYPNELGEIAHAGGPPALWRNGTFVALRKLRQDVASFRAWLHQQGATTQERELVAAKMMGRWRSGCPLALSPERDDPGLAADKMRNNAFGYYNADREGRLTPVGSHIRRVNPRDALQDGLTDVRLHRVLRRGSAYGPLLPEDTVVDDGIDRGIVLALINANPGRQFEFVQAQWINDGDFVCQGSRSDPIVGRRDRADDYAYPAKPSRRRLTALPDFTTTCGGEHVFLPGIGGLRWLSQESERD